VVSLGQAVDALTIAEGVETLDQLAALESMGCQRAQGFLWSPGVPTGELLDAAARCAAVPVPAPSSGAGIPPASSTFDQDRTQ
jgi:EAL domain-containing protein (putative c-di-GMP-specific phosphodiesterase class I)